MKTPKDYTILLIEDSAVDERVIRDIFEREGYQVISAYNQKDGLQMVKAQQPDLVVLDYMLPDGNGLNICRSIKEASKQNRNMLPVIMLTIKKETKDIVAGFRSGADDYVIKPPVREDLLARVSRLLGTSHLHKKLNQTYEQLAANIQQIQRELDIVAKIQRSFLPEQLPKHPRFSISTWYQPSMNASGDYYDIVAIDENHWGIVMADIAGHGASAAVIMGLTQMTVKEFSPGITEPDQALKQFDRVLSGHIKSEHFVTMFYGVLNLHTLELKYASAGHPPPLCYRAQTHELIELENREGFPLVTFENLYMDVQRLRLSPQDKLILYTDGVVDVKNAMQDYFGLNRLKHTILNHHAQEAKGVINRIIQALQQFNKNLTYEDDISMMIIDCV